MRVSQSLLSSTPPNDSTLLPNPISSPVQTNGRSSHFPTTLFIRLTQKQRRIQKFISEPKYKTTLAHKLNELHEIFKQITPSNSSSTSIRSTSPSSPKAANPRVSLTFQTPNHLQSPVNLTVTSTEQRRRNLVNESPWLTDSQNISPVNNTRKRRLNFASLSPVKSNQRNNEGNVNIVYHVDDQNNDEMEEESSVQISDNDHEFRLNNPSNIRHESHCEDSTQFYFTRKTPSCITSTSPSPSPHSFYDQLNNFVLNFKFIYHPIDLLYSSHSIDSNSQTILFSQSMHHSDGNPLI